MIAVKKYGWALMYASPTLKNDKDVVLAVVKRCGYALQFASPTLKKDKEIVLIAVKQDADLIKHALGDNVRRDPDILIAAGMYDEDHDDAITRQQEAKKKKKIVLSTRFSIKPDSHSEATTFTKLLKDNEDVQDNFIAYAPNAFDKKTCDREWTNFKWPCRGTNATCKGVLNFDTGEYTNNALTEDGHPTDNCCWRYSFRSQLQEAKDTGGFMLQLVETGKPIQIGKSDDATLGNGQSIERDMAHSLQMKIFHVYRPRSLSGREMSFYDERIKEVVTAIKKWYDGGCEDMSECIVRIERNWNKS